MKLAEKHKPFVVERFAQFKPLSIRTYAAIPSPNYEVLS